MKALFIAFALLASVSAKAAQNPFNAFLGDYNVVASNCEVNGQVVEAGCKLEEVNFQVVAESIQILEQEVATYSVFPMVAFKTVTKAGITQAAFTGDANLARWTKTQEIFAADGSVVEETTEERSIARDGDAAVYQVVRVRKASGQVTKTAVKTYILQPQSN